MDRKLLIGASLLLILEVIFLFAELEILPGNNFFRYGRTLTKSSIGTIETTQNNVRRKGSESLIWQTSQDLDPIYAYDSVLTLNNSSAKLKLNDDINIRLHENTLVVIEPPEHDQNPDHLFLSFTRGQMRSRSKNSKLLLSHKNWKLDANAGTDMEIRSLQGEGLEVEVLKGALKLNNNATQDSHVITPGQRVELEKNKLKSIKSISQRLQWDSASLYRRYTHQNRELVDLTWVGSAQQLRVVDQNGFTKIEPTTNLQQISMWLGVGTYQLHLENNTETSIARTIEILPAEKIIYFRPRPRDRIVAEKAELFSWAKINQAQLYQIQISDSQEFLSLQQSEKLLPPFQYAIKDMMGELYWRIVGWDSEGFLIPGFYSQKIIVSPNPLAAPKLLAPSTGPLTAPVPIRQPASKTNKTPIKKLKPGGAKQKEARLNDIPRSGLPILLLSLIADLFWIENAHAENAVDTPGVEPIVFRWQSVPGAEFYFIEISLDENFHRLIEKQKVLSTNFTWQNYQHGDYFWRVAAGSLTQVGLFSEPQKVNTVELLNQQNQIKPKDPPETEISSNSKKVKTQNPIQSENIYPKPQQTKATSPIDEPSETVNSTGSERPLILSSPPDAPFSVFPPQEEPVKLIPNLEDEGSFSKFFALATSEFYNYNLASSTNVELLGFSKIHILYESNLKIQKRGSLQLSLGWSQTEWEDKASRVFQPRLHTENLDFSVSYRPFGSHWSTSILYEKRPQILREGNESISISPFHLYGLSINHHFIWPEKIFWHNRICVLTGTEQHTSLQIQTQIDHQVVKSDPYALLLGVFFQLRGFQQSQDVNGYQARLGISVGLQF